MFAFSHLRGLLFALASLLACTPWTQADYAATYIHTRQAVDALEQRIATEIRAGDLDGFMRHFALSTEDQQLLRSWFIQIAEDIRKDGLERILIDLPILGATNDEALICYGRFDVHFKTEPRKRYGWPPTLLRRDGTEWRFVETKLEPLAKRAEVEVVEARFDVTPRPDAESIDATASFTVKNPTSQSLTEFPLYFRFPLCLEQVSLAGAPLEAATTFGTIAEKAALGLVVKLKDALAPGATAELSFRYSACFAYHDLGRKPVGFTENRGFVLWESGWYPHFSQEFKKMPYAMTIAAPPNELALTSGTLLGKKTHEQTQVFSYKTTSPAPPYFLWGRYQETHRSLGQADWAVWTPADGSVDPAPIMTLVEEAFAAFQPCLPAPAFDTHRVVAVTRYGGYGAPGNLLIQDDYFTPARAAKMETLDFVAHELSHSWVNTISEPAPSTAVHSTSFLAEGLATYLGAKAVEKSRSAEDTRALWRKRRKEYQAVADRAVAPRALSEAIQNRDNMMFRAVAYSKGAFFLRELETLIGEETFFRALRETLLAHRGGTFTLDDFTQRVGELTQRNLTPFLNAYLNEASVPDYVVTAARNENGRYRVTLENRGTAVPTPITLAIRDENDRELDRRETTVGGDGRAAVEFDADGRIVRVVLDPDVRVLQSESRNDVFPPPQLAPADAAAIDAMLSELLRTLREGDDAAMDRVLTANESLISREVRARILSNVKAKAPLNITRANQPQIYLTDPDRVAVEIDLSLETPAGPRALKGAFDFIRESDGWKSGMFRIR